MLTTKVFPILLFFFRKNGTEHHRGDQKTTPPKAAHIQHRQHGANAGLGIEWVRDGPGQSPQTRQPSKHGQTSGKSPVHIQTGKCGLGCRFIINQLLLQYLFRIGIG